MPPLRSIPGRWHPWRHFVSSFVRSGFRSFAGWQPGKTPSDPPRPGCEPERDVRTALSSGLFYAARVKLVPFPVPALCLQPKLDLGQSQSQRQQRRAGVGQPRCAFRGPNVRVPQGLKPGSFLTFSGTSETRALPGPYPYHPSPRSASFFGVCSDISNTSTF
jgi:hypothetical protein